MGSISDGGTRWDLDNILRREFELLSFAAERWSMRCCPDNGTITLPREFSAEIPGVIEVDYSD